MLLVFSLSGGPRFRYWVSFYLPRNNRILVKRVDGANGPQIFIATESTGSMIAGWERDPLATALSLRLILMRKTSISLDLVPCSTFCRARERTSENPRSPI